MGQRLNLEIANEDKVLANAYYHWSGYTSSALGIALVAVRKIQKGGNYTPLVQAVKALYSTGAGLTKDEAAAFKKLDKTGHIFIEGEYISRNDGLIAVSEEGKKETKLWQEQGIQIDLDKGLIHTHQAFWDMTKEEYEADFEKEASKLPELTISLDEIKLEDFEKFVAEVSEEHTWYDPSENLVYSWVE